MSFLTRALLALIAVTFFAPVAGAQDNKRKRIQIDKTRSIVAGDQLRISVTEMSSLNKVYPVAGDGTIDLGELGRVEVEDLNTEQAQSKVKDYLESTYFKKATVKISISEFVQGEIRIVHASGGGGAVIPFTGDKIVTLFEAIVKSGGLHNRSNASAVKILRWKPGAGFQREVITVDVSEMFEKHKFDNDEYLRPRDIVFIPNRKGEDSKEILYIGAVGSVGYHQWYEGLNVLRLVANTGGIVDGGQPEAARILRPNETGDYTPIPVDLTILLSQGDMTQNHDLKPGDIVYVPSATYASSGEAFLLGEVGSRGPIALPLKGHIGVAKALLSRGFTPLSNQTRVKLKRKSPDGKKQELFINVKEILDTGDFEKDIPLQDQDIIIVPVSNVNLPFIN